MLIFRGPVTAGFVLIVCLVAAFNVRAVLWRPSTLEGQSPPDSLSRIAGVVHVHTTLSDGRATPEQVIEAARDAGLSFVVITDHGNLDAKRAAGYHDELLVLVGTETSTEAGHLLGIGIPDPAYRFSGDARDTLGDVRDLGGASFLSVAPRRLTANATNKCVTPSTSHTLGTTGSDAMRLSGPLWLSGCQTKWLPTVSDTRTATFVSSSMASVMASSISQSQCPKRRRRDDE